MDFSFAIQELNRNSIVRWVFFVIELKGNTRCHFVNRKAIFVTDNEIFVNEKPLLYSKSMLCKRDATFVTKIGYMLSRNKTTKKTGTQLKTEFIPIFL